MLHLARNIKYIRELFGKTQYEFAEIFGVKDKKGAFSSDKIYTYESARAEPPERFLIQLSDLSGVSIENLKNKELKDSDIILDIGTITKNKTLNEPEITYLEKRRQKMLEEKEVWFPVYQGNTRLREDGHLTVYNEEPEMQVPIGFLPQNMYPGCNHGERVFGNSMYPRIANQGYVAGKIIDKTKIVFGELYGLHLTGNNPAVVKYIHPCDDDIGCVLLVSEKRDIIKDQKINIDDVTLIFRVLFIINPA